MSYVHQVLGSYCSLMRMLSHVVKHCRKSGNVNACEDVKLEFKSQCLKLHAHTTCSKYAFCTVYQTLMKTEELGR